MKITIATDDGVLLGEYSTYETYLQLKEEDPKYNPTEKEIFDSMMDEVTDDAETFFDQRIDS